jgi:pimeloyl-ACP methyl ester carboxylesterase
MKNRAGVVGQRGLGPVITGLAEQFDSLRVHLVGHSFGARLVSYALAGLGDRQPSPVKSLTLLQGAYSRFAFTDALPFRSGSGGLAAASLA